MQKKTICKLKAKYNIQLFLYRKELHDSNKDSISCAGSSGGCSDSTVSAHMESSVEANGHNLPNGLDNDAFETSGGDLSSHLSSSSPRTPTKGHSAVDMELEDFSPKIMVSILSTTFLQIIYKLRLFNQ